MRINALVAKSMRVPPEGWTMKDETPWPGNNSKDHPSMIQVLLPHNVGNELPCLVYTSREKRPAFQHHNKAGAINAMVSISSTIISQITFSHSHDRKLKQAFFFGLNVAAVFPASCISSVKQCSFCAKLGLQSLCK